MQITGAHQRRCVLLTATLRSRCANPKTPYFLTICRPTAQDLLGWLHDAAQFLRGTVLCK
jgi:hypothetical protein